MGKQATKKRSATQDAKKSTGRTTTVVKVKRPKTSVRAEVEAKPAAAEALLKAYLKVATKRGRYELAAYCFPKELQQHAAYRAIADCSEAMQVVVTIAAVDVARAHPTDQTGSACEVLLGLLLRRKLDLPRAGMDRLLELAAGDAVRLPMATAVGFLEKWAAAHACDAEFIGGLRRVRERLSDTYNRKERARLADLIEVLERGVKAAPTPASQAPTPDPQSVARGRKLFAAFKKEACHERFGKIDLDGSASGRAIKAASPAELTGVALAGMEDFARIARTIKPDMHMSAHNLHFRPTYRDGVAELLGWVFRKDLPYSAEQFVSLAEMITRFPVLTLLGCPHFASFALAVERFTKRHGVSQPLAVLLGSVEAGYRADMRADTGRLAERIAAVLREHRCLPQSAPVSGRLEAVLLGREGMRHDGKPSLVERLGAAMVQPPVGDDAGATSFPADAAPERAAVLVAVNQTLASVPDRYDGERRVKVPVAIAEAGWGGAALVSGCIAAMSQKPIRYEFESARAYRFHNGVAVLIYVLADVLEKLGREGVPATGPDLGELCDSLSRTRDLEYLCFQWTAVNEFIVPAAAGVIDGAEEAVLLKLLRYRERAARASDAQQRTCVNRFDERLAIGLGLPMDLGERWSDRACLDLRAMKPAERGAWEELLKLCAAAGGSSPTAKWQNKCDQVLARIPRERVEECLGRWFALVGRSRPAMPGGKVEGRDSTVPSDRAADVLRGLAFVAARYDTPRMAQALGDLAMACYKMVPGVGARCTRPGTSAVWALAQMKGTAALAQLSRVRQLVKFGTAKKVLDTALERLAEQLRLSTDELHEIAAPDFGLSAVGTIEEEAGDFTIQLRVVGGGAEVRVLDADGKVRKSVPEAVKSSHSATLKDLKQTAADIEKMLPAQKDRVERLYQECRSWPIQTWRARYLEHPLVGTLGRRLIWSFARGGSTREGLWVDGAIVDERGRTLEVHGDEQVSLWHPIVADPSQVMAWRALLEERQIRQPFKQAHREIYPLTDAERQTRTYSNRFAAHIIRQNQLMPLCQARGWKHELFVLDSGSPPMLHLARSGLCAHYWVSPTGNDLYGSAGAYAYLETDQVLFTRTPQGEPIPLEQVPALAFSEVMRDVDLFVGVCSVGNNPQWQDGGPDGQYRQYWWSYSFGELTEAGMGRKQLLERLIPRLEIGDRCSFSGKFLAVRGTLRTYRIHLGSGNILMEPNDQYLCIVPSPREAGRAGEVFLPFEGDRALAIILSKAFLLADDAKIRDESILRQIRRR